MENLPVALAFLEDGPPRKPGLCAFEADALEQIAGIARGHAPLGVVVCDVERVLDGKPRTAGHGRHFHDPKKERNPDLPPAAAPASLRAPT